MKDLDIRGAGNLLGAEQSGFIAEIGLEMYQKILQEAMQELKEDEFKDLFGDEDTGLFQRETQIETDLQILIPDHYVTSVHERLNLYNKINDLNSEEGMIAFEAGLEDRFGPVPYEVKELLRSVKLKWQAQQWAIEKLSMKRGRLKAYFSMRADPKFFASEKFGQIIAYVQRWPMRCKLHQSTTELMIQINDTNSAKQALQIFEEIKSIKVD